MALDHSPLDVARLPPAVQKAIAPGPARLMAARGLLPMARPGDLLTVLFQLAVDGDAGIAAIARGTADGLPEKILAGGLVEALDPRVLDWFAARLTDRGGAEGAGGGARRGTDRGGAEGAGGGAARGINRPVLLDLIIGNPNTADATLATLAARGAPREVDLIAQNEQRLLRHPEIIAAMYTNPRARMSTVDRAVELAVRNHVRVPGLAAWEEISRSLTGARPSPDEDAVFAQAAFGFAAVDDTALVSGDAETFAPPEDGAGAVPDFDERNIPISQLTVPSKIRLATLGNAFARSVLIRDPLKMVAVAAIKSPGVSEIEAARYAGNHQIADDVIRYIASRREWTKLYGIKISLVMNPKTPITDSSRLLPHLRDKDLRNVAKSRGIPSAVAAQARKLMAQRPPGGGKHG